MIEKLYFYPPENYLRSGGFDLDDNIDPNSLDSIENGFKKEIEDERIGNVDFSKFFLNSKDFAAKLMMYWSVEYSQYGKNSKPHLETEGLILGKDNSGREVILIFSSGKICYMEKDKEIDVLWSSDANGRYIVLDGKKKYKNGIKALWVDIIRGENKEDNKEFLRVLHLLNSTNIIVDDYGYYISDDTASKEDSITLAVYLCSFFAFRQRRGKLVNIYIPYDILEKEYSKNEFFERFNKEIAIALGVSAYASTPNKMLKSVKKFTCSEEGVTISYVLHHNNKSRSYDEILPTKDVLILL